MDTDPASPKMSARN